jgi:Domain of unknown function DUF29
MATRLNTRASDLYERDIYAWSKAQADLLRAGRFADLDLEHLIEEVADLGESLKRSVRNRVRTIIEHLLKLEYSPAQDTQAGGRATVRRQRVRLRDALTPALQPEVENDLARLYEDARGLAEGALRDHGEHAAAEALPETCPYSFDQITGDSLP